MKTTVDKRKVSGWLFIIFPVIIQIPFNLLVAMFNYPDVLRQPAGEILTSFHSAGNGLTLIWYGYAISISVFIAALILYSRSEGDRWSVGVTTGIGLGSAAIQLIALLRWTFLVPFLARDFVATSDLSARTAIESLFTMQHNFLGIGLGEHLGQLSMALWTVMLIRSDKMPVYLRIVGGLASLFLVCGTAEHFGVVFQFDPGLLADGTLVGFLLWSLFVMGFGLQILRTPSTENRVE